MSDASVRIECDGPDLKGAVRSFLGHASFREA